MSTHPEERKLATIMFTDMVVLKLLPSWGPASRRSALRENCSLVRTEIGLRAVAASLGQGDTSRCDTQERCGSRHFLCNGAQTFGKEWETTFEPTMKTLLIAATTKFALRTCLIAVATCILVTTPSAEADPLAPCISPPLNLVAWWSGDGHPNDIQGTNNGTFSAATYASGKVNQAFSLNGSSAFVEIPDTPSVSIAGAISIDAWINPTTTVAFQTILSKYDSPANQLSYILGVNAGGGLRFVVYQTGNGSISRGVDTASGFVPTGTFTHVAATFDPATQAIKIYVNGVDTNATLIAGSTSVSAIFDSTAAVRIGDVVNSGGGPVLFAGLIDEVDLFNRALSANEVQAIYNAGTPPPANMISWWPANGHFNDIIGPNNLSTVGFPFFDIGKVGQAFGLGDGMSSVRAIGSVGLQVQNFTVDAWIKRYHPTVISFSPPGNSGLVVTQGGDGFNFGLHNDGSLFLYGGGSPEVAPIGLSITDSTFFHHVAVTKNGTTLTFYVDGVGVQASPFTGTFAASTTLMIGARTDSFSNFFYGAIDEVRFFDRALTATEISAIVEPRQRGQMQTTYTDTDSNSNSDDYADSYSHGYPDSDGHFYANSYSHLYANSHSYIYSRQLRRKSRRLPRHLHQLLRRHRRLLQHPHQHLPTARRLDLRSMPTGQVSSTLTVASFR